MRREPDPSVRLSARPDDAWLRLYRREVPVDVLTAVVDGELVFGTQPGRGGRAGGGHRRPGRHPLGGPVGDAGRQTSQPRRALCEALLAWGADRGATRGYIRVPDDDRGAADLAGSLGFRLHHRAATSRPEPTLGYRLAMPDGALRLATWNVNSIRTRLDRVLDWLARAEVDVLAMQETKCSDSSSRRCRSSNSATRWRTVGFNQWNGVAIASRVGLDDVEVGFDGQPSWSSKPDVAAAAEARALAATCAGVRVWSLYVPNGRALGDPHYTYKLNWLAALRDTAAGWLRDDPAAQIALVGDWNIAPTDEDVWSVEFYAGATHVSEPERKAFDAIVDAQFSDVVRPFTPGPGVYTYWDYTQLRFPKRQGMRIDFILASPALAGRVADAQIVREERKGKAPSDHAPVLVDVRRV